MGLDVDSTAGEAGNPIDLFRFEEHQGRDGNHGQPAPDHGRKETFVHFALEAVVVQRPYYGHQLVHSTNHDSGSLHTIYTVVRNKLHLKKCPILHIWTAKCIKYCYATI